MGDFTVADGYLFTVLNWTKFHKIDLSAFPNITAFMEARRGASGGAGGDEGRRPVEGGVASGFSSAFLHAQHHLYPEASSYPSGEGYVARGIR